MHFHCCQKLNLKNEFGEDLKLLFCTLTIGLLLPLFDIATALTVGDTCSRRAPSPCSITGAAPRARILQLACVQLVERATELLVGIKQDPAKYTPSNTRFQHGSSSICRRFCANEISSTPVGGASSVSTPVMEEDDMVDSDFYFLAKSYFDCREYRRAAHVLRDQIGKKAVFLCCYALYLVCCILSSFSFAFLFYGSD